MAPNPLNALVNSVAGSLSLSIICHLSATYMSGPDKCNLVRKREPHCVPKQLI